MMIRFGVRISTTKLFSYKKSSFLAFNGDAFRIDHLISHTENLYLQLILRSKTLRKITKN